MQGTLIPSTNAPSDAPLGAPKPAASDAANSAPAQASVLAFAGNVPADADEISLACDEIAEIPNSYVNVDRVSDDEMSYEVIGKYPASTFDVMRLAQSAGPGRYRLSFRVRKERNPRKRVWFDVTDRMVRTSAPPAAAAAAPTQPTPAPQPIAGYPPQPQIVYMQPPPAPAAPTQLSPEGMLSAAMQMMTTCMQQQTTKVNSLLNKQNQVTPATDVSMLESLIRLSGKIKGAPAPDGEPSLEGKVIDLLTAFANNKSAAAPPAAAPVIRGRISMRPPNGNGRLPHPSAPQADPPRPGVSTPAPAPADAPSSSSHAVGPMNGAPSMAAAARETADPESPELVRIHSAVTIIQLAMADGDRSPAEIAASVDLVLGTDLVNELLKTSDPAITASLLTLHPELRGSEQLIANVVKELRDLYPDPDEDEDEDDDDPEAKP